MEELKVKAGYGEFIKKHRIESGFKSQRRLADKTGISSATISRIESEIQKPEVETLKTLADYLETTSLVELMVKCGYWNEEELLESNTQSGKSNELISMYLAKQSGASMVQEVGRVNRSESSTDSNEDEFINKINLSDEALLKQFDLKVDGESLTEEETKGIIAYIRSLRQMKS